jgi:hypothetical protein
VTFRRSNASPRNGSSVFGSGREKPETRMVCAGRPTAHCTSSRQATNRTASRLLNGLSEAAEQAIYIRTFILQLLCNYQAMIRQLANRYGSASAALRCCLYFIGLAQSLSEEGALGGGGDKEGAARRADRMAG